MKSWQSEVLRQTEPIVSKLRQAEEELSRGLRTPAMCKKLWISK